MIRFAFPKSFLFALFLCLGAATLLAQEADLLPPLPPPYAVPPPEPDTLPPPPQLEWSPLGPKDEGGGGTLIEAATVPSPEAEASIAPPPAPVIETPLPGGPNFEAMELAKPDVEVWRPESESPQTPARLPERLETAYVTGPAPVWLRVQYNPLAAGKRVLVRTGRGITVNVPGGGLTIPPSGECLVQAQLGAGIKRSHVNFYCDGIKTALPVVLASLETVQAAENGGGQEQGTASTGTAASPDEDPEGDTGALKEQVETGGSYSAHSGNASRIVKDLHVPGALGTYGLDFTRYWNSLNNADINIAAEWPTDFGYSGWSHSWRWKAVYDRELPNTEDFPPPYTYETSITVTFPDGHPTKFKLTRGDLNAPPLSRDHRVGPPYYAANYERDWAAPGPGVHDNLAEMAQDGSEFWLYRADGGSVHFVGTNGPNPNGGYFEWRYKATEIYDPHGLKTDLFYEGPEDHPFLTKVVQEGGRWLKINWANYNGQAVINTVQTGGPAPSEQVVQQVIYGYTNTLNSNFILRHVFYANTPAMFQTAWATYDYEPHVLTGPSLKGADDPHFAGAMTKIAYLYSGLTCPPTPFAHPPPEIHDWYYFLPESIGAEMSGETGAIVARFGPACQDGTRRDYNGLGGERILYYGGSAQDGDITGPMGHSLNKMTDFYKEYNPPSNLPSRKQNQTEPTKVWDGRSIMTQLTYDDSGKVASIHHPDDGSTYSYNRINPGNSVDPPDRNRIHNRKHHWLFSKQDELGKVTKYIRDARRRVTRIEYPDSSETFEYDNNNPNGLNQVTSHTLPSGAVETYEYDPNTHLLLRESNNVDGVVKAYTYDALGRVETMRDARALADGAPYTERMEYNGWHQITKIHYRATGDSGDPTVTYEYDKYGNRTAVIDELGHRKDYTYDAYRRCLSLTEQTGSSAGCNNIQERRWDWVYDRVIQYEDGTTTDPPLCASSHTLKEWRIQIEPEFNADRHRRATARVFDVNNRMISEQTGLIQLPGYLPGVNLQSVPGITETHSVIYDENGQKKKSTDSLNRETTYTYDRRNRLETTTEPKRQGQVNSTTRFDYDVAGNKTKVTFPDSKTQRWENYDAFGQPRQFFDEYDRPTDFNYWSWGPMKKLNEVITHREKDGGGPDEDQRTQFFYDWMGRPQTTIFPDGSREISTYNFGQLATYKTRKGQTKIIDIYDGRGREKHHYWRTFEGAVDSLTPPVTRVWDDASRLSIISNAFSTVTYTYDGAGQVRTESTTVTGDNVARTVGYCRYPSGDVGQITYPNGTVITRFYTPRGQLKDVGWGAGATSYIYNRDGTVDSQFRTNNVTTSYGYDGRGLISSVQHAKGQALAKRDYWRDDRDRIRSWKRGSDHNVNPMEDGRGNRYEYDYEGQLTAASYRAENPENGATTPYRNDIFHYDKMGNRMGWNYLANRGTMLFKGKNTGLNQYFSWENSYPPPGALHWGTTTNYDDDLSGWGQPARANGVLMQEGWITGFYNALNQPVGITTTGWNGTGNWMWFGYDPLGRCVKRWVGPPSGTPPNQQVPPAYSNPATYYYYDGSNLIQEGASGAPPADRVYVHGGRMDEIVASRAGGNWSQHQYDAQGNCILLTDSGGNILEQYDYDAFGYPYFYSSTGQQLNSSTSGNRFLFTGREWIKELRLYDYRARMYQPELGRFLQPDPKEFAAGDYNLYRYCHNDPVNRADPSGLQDERRSDQMQTLMHRGGGDWNFDNGRVAMAQINVLFNDNGKFYGAVNNVAHHKNARVNAEEVGRVVVDDAHQSAQDMADHPRPGHHADSGDERAYARYAEGGSLVRKGPSVGHNSFAGPEADLPGYVKGGPAPYTGSHGHGAQGGLGARDFQRNDIRSANGINGAKTPYISSLAWYRDPQGNVNIYVPYGGGYFHSSDGVNFHSGLILKP